MKKNYKEYVFVLRIGSLGDSIVTLPAINAIRLKHPNAEFILITNTPKNETVCYSWDVFKNLNLFSVVLSYNSTPLDFFTLARRILKYTNKNTYLYYLKPNLARIQQFRDLLYFRLICGIPHIIGIRKSDGLFNAKNVIIKEYDRYLRAVRFDTALTLPMPLLHPSEADHTKIAGHFMDIPEKSSVLIGFGTKQPVNKWPLERYIEIAKRIIKKYDFNIVLLGGAEELDDAQKFVDSLPIKKVINLVGQTTISESAAACLHTILYVGNDTGTMHLASVMGVECIGVFSGKNPRVRWEPYGDNNVIIRKDLECVGCGLTECIEKKNLCINSINVEDVWEHVEIKLGKIFKL